MVGTNSRDLICRALLSKCYFGDKQKMDYVNQIERKAF